MDSCQQSQTMSRVGIHKAYWIYYGALLQFSCCIHGPFRTLTFPYRCNRTLYPKKIGQKLFLFWSKMTWMLANLLVPEYIIGKALSELVSAWFFNHEMAPRAQKDGLTGLWHIPFIRIWAVSWSDFMTMMRRQKWRIKYRHEIAAEITQDPIIHTLTTTIIGLVLARRIRKGPMSTIQRVAQPTWFCRYFLNRLQCNEYRTCQYRHVQNPVNSQWPAKLASTLDVKKVRVRPDVSSTMSSMRNE